MTTGPDNAGKQRRKTVLFGEIPETAGNPTSAISSVLVNNLPLYVVVFHFTWPVF
jgi:hypothetical protein